MIASNNTRAKFLINFLLFPLFVRVLFTTDKHKTLVLFVYMHTTYIRTINISIQWNSLEFYIFFFHSFFFHFYDLRVCRVWYSTNKRNGTRKHVPDQIVTWNTCIEININFYILYSDALHFLLASQIQVFFYFCASWQNEYKM